MSTATTRVKDLLSSEMRSQEEKQRTARISESDLRKAVKEGVREAMAEHEERHHGGSRGAAAEAMGDHGSDMGSSSRRGPSLKRVLLYGVMMAIVYYVRRSRKQRA